MHHTPHYQRIIILCLLTFFISFPAISQKTKPATGNKPSWVITVAPDYKASKTLDQVSGGFYILLSDVQKDLKSSSAYSHYVIRVMNPEGIQNVSDLSVEYNPAYQKLTFHEVSVYRDGIKTDKLKNYKINAIQRETEMERFQYDGSYTAIINLSDVRIGDVVEYSYTITGLNPIYGDHFFDDLDFDYRNPTDHYFFRLISLVNKTLYFKYLGGSVDPSVKINGDVKEYTWSLRQIKGLLADDNIPAWFRPGKSMIISDFRQWKDVLSWILPFYTVTAESKKRIKKAMEGIYTCTNDAEKLLEAIRFVQDEVRYLGIESGLYSIVPHPSDKVLKQRYGDCKDKSMLLCTILQTMGLEAYPVLVSHRQIQYYDSVHPSPGVFDHCIVQLTYNKIQYYVDPTISHQGGSLSDIYCPQYGYGLLLSPNSPGITRIVSIPLGKTLIKDKYEIKSFDLPVKLFVHSEYFGRDADFQRSTLAYSRLDEVEKDYVNYYSNVFPGIKSVKLPVITDNRESNALIIDEEYFIPNFWKKDEDDTAQISTTIYPLLINQATAITNTPVRTMPYAIRYPLDYTQQIEVYLPVSWNIETSNTILTDEAFEYRNSIEYGSQNGESDFIRLTYSFKTLQPFLPAEKAVEFTAEVKKISDKLGYSLTYNRGVGSGFKMNWYVFIFELLVIVAGIFGAIRLFRRYDPEGFYPEEEGRPLGGWLIMIAIGIIIGPLRILYQTFSEATYFNLEISRHYLEMGSAGKGIILILLGELLFNTLTIIYLIMLNILFFRRRTSFPKLMIIFYIASMIIIIADSVLVYILSEGGYITFDSTANIKSVIMVVLGAAIWVPYFIYSYRVKETFVFKRN